MTAIDTAIEGLRSAIADLDLQIQQLTAQRSRIAFALDQLAPDAPVSASARRNEAPKTGNTVAAKPRGQHPCPECDFVAGAAAGLGAHRKAKHGVAGKTYPAITADSPTVHGKVFYCNSCDREFSSVTKIAEHTDAEHHRPTSRSERTPVERAA
jgi:ribosomal protein L37AE/L43A